MKLRKRTNAYWERRSLERLTATERASAGYANRIANVYDLARRDTVADIRKLYAAYYKSDKSFDKQALNSIAPNGDIWRFKQDMKRLGLDTFLPERYAGRMTRLELLNAQMWGRMKEVGLKENALSTDAYTTSMNDAYYRTIFDTAKGIGATPAFSTLQTNRVEKILAAKFEGKNYSERIWGNTDILAEQLQEKLAKAIASGQSQEKTVREIQERFGVGKYYAERLVRTEANYFANRAEIESYSSLGVEEYVFVATLDSRTSAICAAHDGKRYKVEEAISGENLPPLHPNCRSTIRAYLGKDFEPEVRIARDPVTGKNMHISQMDYSQWLEAFGIKPVKASSVKTPSMRPAKSDSDFAEEIGVSEPYWHNQMEIGERAFVRNFTEDHKIKWIDRNQFDQATGNMLPTYDLIWRGKEWELKTATAKPKYSTISTSIRNAAKQGKKNFVYDIHKYKFDDKLREQLSSYNLRNPNNKIDNLIVYSKDGTHKISLK